MQFKLKARDWFPALIIQRYLGSHFIWPFILSCFFFVVFLLTFQLFRIIRIMTAKGVDFSSVVELVGHISVSFLPMAVPLSTLFAAIYTMNKMSEDSELVAMRSFGLTKKTLITPFVLLGVLIAGVIFVLNTNLIPHSKTQFKNTLIQLTSQGLSADIKSGQFFTEIPGITLFAEKVRDGGTKLENVFILQSKDDIEQAIAARKGALIKQDLGELRTPMLRLYLEDGNIAKFAKDKKIEKILFEQYDFPIVSGGHLPGFVSKDSMKSSKVLWEYVKFKNNRALELGKMKNKSLDEERELRAITKDLPRSKLELWGRFNTPIQVIVFVVLGFCLGVKRGRGRSQSSSWTGFLVLLSYYILFFVGLSLAKKSTIPAPFAVFFPTFLATILGGYYYHRLDWQS